MRRSAGLWRASLQHTRFLHVSRPLGRPLAQGVRQFTKVDGVRPAGLQGRFMCTASKKEDAPEEESSSSDSGETKEEVKKAPEEVVTGDFEQLEFQAETRKLLDIVAGSLYSDKEVFIRELISNSSDAIEKARHARLKAGATADGATEAHEYRIDIVVDEKKNEIIIQDTGIGMTKEELVENLGTIARSGSMAFVEQMSGETGADAKSIIGKFGVGFYSSFIVGNEIKVFSKSAVGDNPKGYLWKSDGSGKFSIAEADNVATGTKIVISLRDDAKQFSEKRKVEDIIKKYSNFITTPITLNGDRLNTMEPLWTKGKSEVSPEDHAEFYRYISNAYDDPQYYLHFSTDIPMSIQSIFYFPKLHFDLKYGMGRMEPGVNLHSRKVLVQAKAKGLLPEWLRFVKGVVDCEDVPLNLSREFTQDNALINRLNGVLTTRILRFMNEKAKKDKEGYVKWYKDFGNFIKEGVCMDNGGYKNELAKLLRYESSKVDGLTSLDEYKDRMQPEQKAIYVVHAPTRQLASTSPYVVPLVNKDIEVLYMYDSMDDFVAVSLQTFKDSPIQSVDSPDVDQSIFKRSKDEIVEEDKDALTPDQEDSLKEWLVSTLGEKVETVKLSERDLSVPALIVGSESAATRRIMKMMDQASGDNTGAMYRNQKQTLEVNPDHIVTKRLNVLREENPKVAEDVAHQMFDNALVAAGLLEDARPMLGRLNTILEYAVGTTPAQKAADFAAAKEAMDSAKEEVVEMETEGAKKA